MNHLDQRLVNSVKDCDFSMIKDLVEQGADVHVENDFPLRICAFSGSIEWVK
jgi:hypothetical protein